MRYRYAAFYGIHPQTTWQAELVLRVLRS
jgi:hypothetical protein